MNIDINHLHGLFMRSAGVNTDTRTIKPGEMFFALKGENFDGNEYAGKALEAGAAYAVVSSGSEAAGLAGKDARIIPVDDTLATLKALARTHRCAMTYNGKRLTVIGLTGTNGKTTTKELIRAVLEKKYKVAATKGNLNNEIGVPLSILSIASDTQIAVIEMGASHPGDILELVSIAEPDCGLITNIGKAHLEGFGSLEGVMHTKGELYDFLRTRKDSFIFLHADSPYLPKMATGLTAYTYGTSANCDIRGELTGNSPYLSCQWQAKGKPDTYSVQTRLIGSYNLTNVLCAVSVGNYFGVPADQINEALQGYEPQNNRSQLKRTERNTLIIDAYNANPTSMQAALENFVHMEAPNKMAILGDMFELGNDSEAEHQRVVDYLTEQGLKDVLLVGQNFGRTQSSYRHYEDVEALRATLLKQAPEGKTILIKGSNGNHLTSIIDLL